MLTDPAAYRAKTTRGDEPLTILPEPEPMTDTKEATEALVERVNTQPILQAFLRALLTVEPAMAKQLQAAMDGELEPDPRMGQLLDALDLECTALRQQPSSDILDGGWQPIETRPRGDCLLWQPPFQSGRTHLPGRIIVSGLGEGYVRQATHWMPLPKPPKEAAALKGSEDTS